VCCTGHITKSELHFYAKYGNPPSTAKAAAWLTGKNTHSSSPRYPVAISPSFVMGTMRMR